MASDPKSGDPRPFDVKTVEHLIGLMGQHELTEISLQEGDHKIRLRKGGEPVAVAPVAYHPAAAAPMASAPAASAAPAPAGKKLHDVKSEMVGTFYSKPKPDKDDYVKVGSTIKPNSVICQIEAMKIFNEVTAGCAGTIAEVLVKNSEPVEFGTVLFRVDTGS
ncbi:acetyl-CoA carboxylase biotin carboxyl carrier protein [Fimbriiglobus ruber]|uniref:Biotin carboxyl carrier protein of acetyl-CoA carboxylase n=1 Tax=Fimbriiglobus ruber TaxID=1908690 RepID=A0A225DVU0_9BACT|nr:acetyl-CoA carboxylase biotin carboxyl carrier protein [Fimbriiglobus ruber]OWK40307.1 Biotin carboxyl carrier protein of acetyl-CoA carboxylase [Fimbriiglobus ruber]